MASTTFDYKVRDKDGRLVSGQLDGANLALVAAKLRDMGLAPVEIKPVKGVNFKTDINIPGLSDRVKMKEVALMSRQLATMVAAGLSLVRSLSVLSEQIESKPLREAMIRVRADVEQGTLLSAALERHPKIFPPLYISMVKAGEVGGALDLVLLKLSSTLESQVQLRAKVKSAMMYPAIVMSLVVVIVTALMIFVVPIFKNLFASLGAKLPLPTLIVVAVSNIIASVYLLVVIAAIVIIIIAFKKWIATPGGRLTWDRLKLKPPIFGPLMHKVALTRFTSTLASLLTAGVPIIESLDIVASNSGNEIVANAVRGAQEGVRQGQTLSSTLAQYDVMPMMVTQMIETGEESGALDEMLDKVAEFYEAEVNTTIQSLTSVLEPLLIVTMGACIGFIVVAMYLPMFNIYTIIQKNGASAG
jgi:type IV pilus assembly protein PilC